VGARQPTLDDWLRARALRQLLRLEHNDEVAAAYRRRLALLRGVS